MADSRVRDLTAASALTGTEVFYVDDGSIDAKATATQIKTFALGGAASTYLQLTEIAAPGVGSANTARIFAVDNGSGKTQIKVQFASGTAVIIATEP